MTKRPFSVTVTLILILLDALFWLVFGGIVVANAHPGLPDLPYIKEIMAFLAFATAGALLVLFFLLGKQYRIAWFLALALLGIIALLTIFDQFGMSDLFVLIINIVPVILLIKDRAWYIR